MNELSLLRIRGVMLLTIMGWMATASLLFLSLIVASQTLANGRTTVLQGTIHLMLFAIYLFTTFVP